MWNLHNTSCSTDLSGCWSTPPFLAACTTSIDDHDLGHEHPTNPSSTSPCEDDVSISTSTFTNASGHSALTAESSHRPPVETAASLSCELMIGGHGCSHHLWSHFLLSNDTCEEDLHKCHPEVQENLPGMASPMKSASTSGILEQAACDYLTKLENGYSDNPSDKDYFCRNMSSFIDGGRLSKFNDLLIKDWTTATLHESSYDAMRVSSGYLPREMVVGMGSERHPCKGHNYPNTESEAPYSSAVGEHASAIELHHNRNKIISCGGGRSLEGLVSFGSRLISQPPLDVKLPRLGYSPNTKKLPAGPKNTSTARGNGSGITNEGKKRRCDQDSLSAENPQKKHKHKSSTVTSSSKVPVSNVKLGDRIAALQQIVSPFGKTDTASVLMEAFAYIKFLQEQVQLLISNPYLKAHPHREYPWGGGGVKLMDLRSRGLCLVPISCTPEGYREKAGSDYRAPPYRGIFYSHE